MNRDEFLSRRLKGIGGSDMAAVAGLSKWKTPLQVWQEKMGITGGAQENEAMKWGHLLEPVIRQEYAERNGKEVLTPTELLTHKDHPYLIGNIDGYTNDGRIVEIKTARYANGWGDPDTDQVPTEYLIQVQHYMMVTGFDVADIAVLISGSDYRQYEIRADKDLQSQLIEIGSRFWKRVEDGTPPDAVSYSDAKYRFQKPEAGEVTASEEIDKAIETLKSIKSEIKALESAKEEAEKQIMINLGAKEVLVDLEGNTLATWKFTKPTARFDSKAFKAAHPELYKQFSKTGEPSRRLLIK